MYVWAMMVGGQDRKGRRYGHERGGRKGNEQGENNMQMLMLEKEMEVELRSLVLDGREVENRVKKIVLA